MHLSQKAGSMSPEAYLEWEKGQVGKHEYVNGDVFAMVGAKDSHVTVAGNLFAILRSHLKGGPCRACMSDMKARLDQVNAFFYPDVMITCDPRDRETDYFKRYPLLIAEVLSDSTAAFDRGGKFAAYRQLESLQEYLLIDPDRPSVDCFRKDASEHWVLYPYDSGETVELASVKLSLAMDALYEGVARTEASPP